MVSRIAVRGGPVIAGRARHASGFGDRLRGLLGRKPLAKDEALVLDPAHQVHTVGMRYPIDVVFCDRTATVIHVVRGLQPNRVTRFLRRARFCIELPAGSAEAVVPGDQLELSSL